MSSTCDTYFHCMFYNGMSIPSVGFGTWQAQEEELEKALEAALDAGYRHIDTAYAYENEHVIGKVLQKYISSGKINREDLFVVTKLPPVGMTPEGVEKFLKLSLKALQLDYLDLYLIHTPFAFADIDGEIHPIKDGKIVLNKTSDIIAIWKAMEKQVDNGKVKAIGISNFNISQITRVLNNARIKPASLQIELHAYHQQEPLVDFCRKHGIVVTAYSPLGAPGLAQFVQKLGAEINNPNILEDPQVLKVAKKYNKLPAQILLRHAIQKGIVVIPKSTNPERISKNLDLFGFNLSDEDMETMNNLNKNMRFLDFTVFPGVTDHPEYPF